MADFDPIASGLGIGQGMAQVFGPFEDKYATKTAELYAKKAEEEGKEKAARQEKILSGLSKVKDIDILASDQPRFAEAQKKIYDYTAENIDKLNAGDVGTTLEFNNMLNKFALDAAHSKDYREKHQQVGQTLLTNKDKFAEDASDIWLQQGMSSFDDKGNYRDLDITKYKAKEKPFDVFADFRENALPAYDEVKSKYYYYEPTEDGGERKVEVDNFTANDAAKLVQTRWQNPEVRQKVNEMWKAQASVDSEFAKKYPTSYDYYYDNTGNLLVKKQVSLGKKEKDKEGFKIDFSGGSGIGVITDKYTYTPADEKIPAEKITSEIVAKIPSDSPDRDRVAQNIQKYIGSKYGDLDAKSMYIATNTPGENKVINHSLWQNGKDERFFPRKVMVIGGKEYLEGVKAETVDVKDPETGQVIKQTVEGKSFVVPMHPGLRAKINAEYQNFMNAPSYYDWSGLQKGTAKTKTTAQPTKATQTTTKGQVTDVSNIFGGK